MTKNSVKSFALLVKYAARRAARSLARNDPWAFAYWKSAGEWGRLMLLATSGEITTLEGWMELARNYLSRVRQHVACECWIEAAVCYSRAKWCVIIARNQGFRMPTQLTGVSPRLFEKEPA